MISTPQDYQSLLYRIQDENKQKQVILLPTDETIYDINLDTRTISVPDFLSVENDHRAETIYFKVDRYVDNIDLANQTCIIKYKNANPDKKKNSFIYAVPFIDVTTYQKENKILFPWVIEGPVTAFPGTIEFSISFYQLAISGKEYIYNLNTLPNKTKILHGMNPEEASENYNYSATTLEDIYKRIDDLYKTQDLYWIEV